VDAGFELGSPPDEAVVSPYTVRESQRKKWLADGYCVLDSLLSPAQLERWRTVLDSAVDGRTRRMPLADDPQNSQTAMYSQRCGLRFNDRELNALVFEMGKVVGAAASALNSHSAGFRLYLDNVLIKEPWGDPTRWHIDTYSFNFNSKMTTSFWIPLDDATHRNGCLHFLKASHLAVGARADPFKPAGGTDPKTSKALSSTVGGVGGLFASSPELESLEDVAVPVRAGDVIVHNALTAHAAGANMSKERRRAIVLHMMPEGENRFNGNRGNPFLTEEDRDVLEVGAALDESLGEGGLGGFTFPLVHRG
jgi:ectoine hydroxylase-related dioxygenase (phytanoyl-CoA dioxygenase family)